MPAGCELVNHLAAANNFSGLCYCWSDELWKKAVLAAETEVRGYNGAASLVSSWSHLVEPAWRPWLRSVIHALDNATDASTEKSSRQVVGLAYLLECGVRRLAFHVLGSDRSERSGKRRAVHSVMLSDIVISLIDSFQASNTMLSVLNDIQCQFIDPRRWNTRNIVMHGFLSVVNCDFMMDVAPSQGHDEWPMNYCRFIDDVSTVFAALLLRLADVTTKTFDGAVDESILFGAVGVESHEARRLEAVHNLREFIDAQPHASPSGENSQIYSMHDVLLLIESLTQLEFAMRLCFCRWTHEESLSDAVSAFLPVQGQHFSDVQELMMSIQTLALRRGKGLDCLDHLFEGGRLGWEFWFGLLAKDSGPKIRDLLFHCKWLPLNQEPAGWGDRLSSLRTLRVLTQQAANQVLSIATTRNKFASICDLPMRSTEIREGAQIFRERHLLMRRLMRWFRACDAGAPSSTTPAALPGSCRLLISPAKSVVILSDADEHVTSDSGSELLVVDALSSSSDAASLKAVDEVIRWAGADTQVDDLLADNKESFGELHAVLTCLQLYWRQFDARTEDLARLVASRKARDTQRLQYRIRCLLRRTMLQLSFVRVSDLAMTCTDSKMKVFARQKCRECSSLFSMENTLAIHATLWGLLH